MRKPWRSVPSRDVGAIRVDLVGRSPAQLAVHAPEHAVRSGSGRMLECRGL